MGDLIKSIYAGFMIGIGGTIYLSLDNKIIGSFLFSFGLLTIITQNFNLYTGKVGYENSFKELGIMMYLAVDNYKKNHHIIYIILPVVIFILSGYEHSIANLFYLFLYGEISKQMIVFMIICILGNAVGAKSFHIIKEINNGINHG